jgi:hypothetical protein
MEDKNTQKEEFMKNMADFISQAYDKGFEEGKKEESEVISFVAKLVQQAYNEGFESGFADGVSPEVALPNDVLWENSEVKHLLEKLTGPAPKQRAYKFINDGDKVYRLVETGAYIGAMGEPELEKEFSIQVVGCRRRNQSQVMEIAALIAKLLNLYYQK